MDFLPLAGTTPSLLFLKLRLEIVRNYSLLVPYPLSSFSATTRNFVLSLRLRMWLIKLLRVGFDDQCGSVSTVLFIFLSNYC